MSQRPQLKVEEIHLPIDTPLFQNASSLHSNRSSKSASEAAAGISGEEGSVCRMGGGPIKGRWVSEGTISHLVTHLREILLPGHKEPPQLRQWEPASEVFAFSLLRSMEPGS